MDDSRLIPCSPADELFRIRFPDGDGEWGGCWVIPPLTEGAAPQIQEILLHPWIRCELYLSLEVTLLRIYNCAEKKMNLKTMAADNRETSEGFL